MSEKLFVKMRYAFAAGYTMPQFCVDNDIAKPLFVLSKDAEYFLREIYAQFHYDGRLTAQFCFTDADEKVSRLKLYLGGGLLRPHLSVKHVSAVNADDFDKIILLTKTAPRINAADKIISFADVNHFFVRRAYVDIPLLNFLQRRPDVKLIVTNFPVLQDLRGGKEFNAQLQSADAITKALRAGVALKTPLDKLGYSPEQILELVEGSEVKKNLDGTTALVDDNYPLRRIHDGRRATAYQPEKYLNTIYFFGSCHHYGVNAPFDKTIESYLQLMLNEHNLPYRVENCSQHFAGRYEDIFRNLNALNPAPGDIIFMWIANLRANNDAVPFCDVSRAFDPPHNFREIYCRQDHVNELGYKIIAEKYFDYLTANNFFRDRELKYPPPPAPCLHRYGIPQQYERGGSANVVNAELEAYKQTLRAKRISIGAVVMNCNPFTLGHRALVEYAAAQVVKLYVFVVEEDKSQFPFADRIELVRQGVKDLSNVEVLPSGKFIISQQTFSGYFNKAELQDVAVDSSEDVEIFGREIAPTLGITIRFAGEEPTDTVTRQYNETMKKILPRYGVEFREIPRKAVGDEVISASTVREALKRGDFDKIKSLVPDTTLLYLRGRRSVLHNKET